MGFLELSEINRVQCYNSLYACQSCPHFPERPYLIKVWVSSLNKLTGQTDFGDRGLIRSRRPPTTKEKQVRITSPKCFTHFFIHFTNFLFFHSGIFIFPWSLPKHKHKTDTPSVIWTGYRSDSFLIMWHYHVLFQFWLTLTHLTKVMLTQSPPLADLMQLQPLTHLSSQSELLGSWKQNKI